MRAPYDGVDWRDRESFIDFPRLGAIGEQLKVDDRLLIPVPVNGNQATPYQGTNVSGVTTGTVVSTTSTTATGTTPAAGASVAGYFSNFRQSPWFWPVVILVAFWAYNGGGSKIKF